MWWYYFDLLYPSQFVLAGITLTALPSLVPRPGPGRRAVAAVSIGLAAALVVSQTAMLVAFQRGAARQGQLVLDVPHFSINATGSPFGRLASLPLGYRSRLVRTLLEDFGVGPDGFARRVHGGVLGLPEDNDYLVQYLGGRVRPGPPGGGYHYLVVRDDGPGPLPGGLRSARVGPYRIAEYRPTIDYASWSYATVTTADPGGAAGRWTRRAPTWPRLEVDLQDRQALLLRATLRVPAPATGRAIAVGVVAWAPTSVEVALDGASARSLGQTLGQAPLMIQQGSRWLMGVGWAREALFELDPALPPREHSLLVRVTGEGRVISVDVFERDRPRPHQVSG
jgi:hypothetical protein